MAQNQYNQMMDLNLSMLRDEVKKRKKRFVPTAAHLQADKNTARADAYRQRQDALSAEIMARGDRANQRLDDKHMALGISEGRLNPALSGQMSEGGRTGLAAANPRGFPGLSEGSKSGSSSSGGGLSANQLVGVEKTIDQQLAEEYKMLRDSEGGAPLNSMEEPLAQQQYMSDNANRTKIRERLTSGVNQQTKQSPLDPQTEMRANNLDRDQNLESYQYGFMDNEGRYVDPRKITMKSGENGMYGVDEQGNKRAMYFRGAGVGQRAPNDDNFESGGYSAGSGMDFMNRAAGVRGTPSKAPQVSAPNRTERSAEQVTSPKDVPEKQPRPEQKDWQKRADKRREELAQEEKAQTELPKNITREKLMDLASLQPERDPKNPHEAIYGIDRGYTPRSIATRVQSFMNTNMPEGMKQFGEDEIAFELRSAGLSDDLAQLKNMSRNLRMRYPDASEKEIINMIRSLSKKKG